MVPPSRGPLAFRTAIPHNAGGRGRDGHAEARGSFGGRIMLDFAQARRTMVDGQLRTFDVTDLAVLAAMNEVPREAFVAPGLEALAYLDQDLPVTEGGGGEARRMLKPMVLARLVQALGIEAGTRVLDVAGGLGYSAAVMARLGGRVAALEADEAMAAAARDRLRQVGAQGVNTVAGPLEAGYPGGGPYDAVLVNGAVELRPTRLLEQLADGGRLACIEGRGGMGKAVLYVRAGDAYGSRALFDAAAPPLSAFRKPPAFVF